MVIYIGAFLGIAAYVMYFLTTLIEEQLLGKSYEAAIVLTLTGAAFWGLWKGLESRLRVYEVLFWILILPLGFILLAACSGVCTDYWTPVVDTSWQNFGKGILLCVLIFSLSLLAFRSKSQCSRPKQLLRATRRSLCAVVIWNAIIYLILLGVFQVGLLSHLSYPIIDLMAVVKLPGNFLERQDALMMGIWLFCLFALLNSMLYYASAPLEKLFSEKGRPKATGNLLSGNGSAGSMAVTFGRTGGAHVSGLCMVRCAAAAFSAGGAGNRGMSEKTYQAEIEGVKGHEK